jgi:hypothetical protein
MEGAVFAPFHYGHWNPDPHATDADRRLANDLTMTVWDPVSKQPYFKTAACRVTKLRDGDGPSPAPTTAASAPARRDAARRTAGGAPTSSEVLAEAPRYPLDPSQSDGRS